MKCWFILYFVLWQNKTTIQWQYPLTGQAEKKKIFDKVPTLTFMVRNAYFMSPGLTICIGCTLWPIFILIMNMIIYIFGFITSSLFILFYFVTSNYASHSYLLFYRDRLWSIHILENTGCIKWLNTLCFFLFLRIP